MAGLRLSRTAERDIIDILVWSETQFGGAARAQYERLITVVLSQIALDPLQPLSVARPELGDGVRSWHLSSSRQQAAEAGANVARPRHFIIYRLAKSDLVEVGRLLHDAMELERHLQRSDVWE